MVAKRNIIETSTTRVSSRVSRLIRQTTDIDDTGTIIGAHDVDELAARRTANTIAKDDDLFKENLRREGGVLETRQIGLTVEETRARQVTIDSSDCSQWTGQEISREKDIAIDGVAVVFARPETVVSTVIQSLGIVKINPLAVDGNVEDLEGGIVGDCGGERILVPGLDKQVGQNLSSSWRTTQVVGYIDDKVLVSSANADGDSVLESGAVARDDATISEEGSDAKNARARLRSSVTELDKNGGI